MSQLTDRIVNDFSYHAPKGDQVARYQEIRDRARSLALFLGEVVPPGREQALALTNLEQTVFWSNAGISRAPSDG
jgi:hypothetical protein